MTTEQIVRNLRKELDRQYLGYEIDEHYFNIADARIGEHE